MKNKVFVTCAVNGSGDTASKHPDLPKTPKQIANSAIAVSYTHLTLPTSSWV